jgi:hypothetical protein
VVVTTKPKIVTPDTGEGAVHDTFTPARVLVNDTAVGAFGVAAPATDRERAGMSTARKATKLTRRRSITYQPPNFKYVQLVEKQFLNFEGMKSRMRPTPIFPAQHHFLTSTFHEQWHFLPAEIGTLLPQAAGHRGSGEKLSPAQGWVLDLPINTR